MMRQLQPRKRRRRPRKTEEEEELSCYQRHSRLILTVGGAVGVASLAAVIAFVLKFNLY